MYKYFNSNEDLKKQYRELCKRLHPDHGGNEENFKEMMAEYERIQLEGFKQQAREAGEEIAPEVMEILKKIIHFHGLEIDVVGSWIWVSGNTFLYKEQLKELGFRWNAKRKKWYFGEKKGKGTFKGDYEELKQKYGWQRVQGSNLQAIA